MDRFSSFVSPFSCTRWAIEVGVVPWVIEAGNSAEVLSASKELRKVGESICVRSAACIIETSYAVTVPFSVMAAVAAHNHSSRGRLASGVGCTGQGIGLLSSGILRRMPLQPLSFDCCLDVLFCSAVLECGLPEAFSLLCLARTHECLILQLNDICMSQACADVTTLCTL